MKRFIFLLLQFLLITGVAVARDEYTKLIRKEFPVNADAQLVIDNKFGKVHCNNWDKNVISIEVKITLTAGSESSATKALEKVNIAMSGTPSQVIATTQITDGGFSGRTQVDIDYTVNMPATVAVDLTNKFGDIFINEVTGKSRITLSYGNLDVNKLDNSDNLLEINFGKANIRSIKGAVVTLKYSELDLGYAGSLRLDSKYSDLDADRIIAMTGTFEGGKLNVETNTALDSKSRFSDLNITRIEKTLNLDIQYGSCDVDEVPADFTSITIKNKYANVSVGINEGASYLLDASLKFCEIDFPEEKADITQRIITNTSKSYRGTVGTTANPVAKVNVVSEFGNIDLK